MVENREVEVEIDKLIEIEKSYSGDTIADTKTVRRPFKYEGRWYVSTGGSFVGTETRNQEAYQIVTRGEFRGEARFYGEGVRETENEGIEDWAAQRRAQPEGFYHGMLVKRGKTEWVLVGPPLVFIPKKGSLAKKQLQLF